MNKINTAIVKIISCLTITSILLSGCGEIAPIPELLEPVTNNQSFRPVEYKTIGSPKILVGSYVPQEYCHFFKKVTTIKEITCNIGQYVNEGDILAYADVEKLQEELEDQQAALALCIAEHEVKQPIYDYTVRSLQSQRDAANYLEDTDGVTTYNTQIKVANENHTYDEALYAFMVESYNKEIAEIEELITDGTLKAKKSGYVSYIKNTATGNVANINENVVIVSDYEDTHIEVPGLTPKNYLYKDFKIKYALIGGKETDIEEVNYTNQELAYAKAQDSYPNVRFQTVDGTTGKPGELVIMYFLSNSKKSVLAVGRDSSNADENGNYVYVKGENDNVEKRYFKPGISDDNYMEVVSGLEEGEMVQYVQNAAVPGKYEPYTVTLSDYTQNQDAKRYRIAETINTAYFTPCDGIVKSMNAATDTKVKKGDVLAVIDSGGGVATLTGAENDLTHLDKDYAKQCSDMDKQAGQLMEQSLRLITTLEMAETPDGGSTLSEQEIDAIGCQRGSLENEAKIVKQEKEIVRLEYEENRRQMTNQLNKLKKNNEGNGQIEVIAKEDGVVTKTNVRVGTKVEMNGENNLLFSCTQPTNGIITVTMPQNDSLNLSSSTAPVYIGQKVTFTSPDDESEKFEGVCVGHINNSKNYAFTEGDKVYVTSCINDARQNNFVASVSDDTFFVDGAALSDYKAEVEIKHIPQVICLPGSMIYSEKIPLTETLQYFVWKIEGDELTKQYITMGTQYGIGNDTQAVILTGLNEGDILAKELTTTSTKSEE